MFLYCWGIEQKYGFHIDEVVLWFVRIGREYTFKNDENECRSAIKWFEDEIHKIESEEEWKATPSQYFCSNLCGVREICPYRVINGN